MCCMWGTGILYLSKYTGEPQLVSLLVSSGQCQTQHTAIPGCSLPRPGLVLSHTSVGKSQLKLQTSPPCPFPCRCQLWLLPWMCPTQCSWKKPVTLPLCQRRPPQKHLLWRSVPGTSSLWTTALPLEMRKVSPGCGIMGRGGVKQRAQHWALEWLLLSFLLLLPQFHSH